MGGFVCAIPVNAVLRYHAVPTRPADIKRFDAQIREVYANPVIAEAFADKENLAMEVCAILAKKSWTTDERERLLYVVNELYEDED